LKNILLSILFLSFTLHAQDYVDIVKVGYGQTFNNNFEGSTHHTSIKSFDVDLTYPIVLSEQNALITGIAFSQNNLQLYPEANFTNLYSSTLKIGLASTLNDLWSTTVVLLPKFASDYQNITKDDFYMGGFAVLKYKKKENLIYRFGIYSSSEAFGLYATPIIGWYYLSPNQRFEMDMSLPISGEMNYNVGVATIGFDYFGIGRSFRLYESNDQSNSYVDLSSLEFSSYVQLNTLENSVLFRAKFGYSSNDYEVYADDNTIDFGLAAFTFGDDRSQLNPNLKGGLFVKFEAIYRFQIKKEKTEIEKTKS
jgi:hypothetical protein